MKSVKIVSGMVLLILLVSAIPMGALGEANDDVPQEVYYREFRLTHHRYFYIVK